MKRYLAFLGLIFSLSLTAQNKKSVMLKAGNHVMDILTPADVYYFPKFGDGNVYFKDGTKSSGRLNYNFLINEIQFIDGNGDTVSLADEKNISFVAINSDLFYYDKGYVRLISGNNKAKLTVSNAWKVGEIRRGSVYNTTTPASSLSSFTSYFVFGKQQDLMVTQDVELTRHEQYFFADKFNRILPANKKNLLTLFPAEQSRIEIYLRENKTDFANADDLKKIIAFLGRP